MDTAASTPTATNTRTRPAGSPALQRLLTIAEFSDYLGIPVATIYDWRVGGKGPRALRIGRHLRFSVADVQAWLERMREAEPGR